MSVILIAQPKKPALYIGAATDSVSEYKVDINTAGIEQLVRINALGEKTAQAIIDYRNENGKYNIIDEIQNVKGVGEKKFEQWKDYICVGK